MINTRSWLRWSGLAPLRRFARLAPASAHVRRLRSSFRASTPWGPNPPLPACLRHGAASRSQLLATVSTGQTGPTCLARSALVVSHHLDGFLRAAAAGLLHPAADPGVRRVSSRFIALDPKVSLDSTLGPRDAPTLQRVSLAKSRAASPRPMPPCRSPCCTLPIRRCSAASQSADFEALLP